MERAWFYAEAGQQAGPVEEEDLKNMIRGGRLPPDVMVWTEGYAQWVPAPWVLEGAGAEPFFGYANFLQRGGAFFIDVILLNIIAGFFGFFASLLYGLTGQTAQGAEIFGGALGVIAGWLYSALFESSHAQATPGKMLLGIKVTDLNGGRISFARATGRHFGHFLSGVFCLIGYFMAIFTEKKQALHDILAGCLVVRTR